MNTSSQLILELEGGETLAGSVRSAAVECRGERVDVDHIIAMDRRTVFLAGSRQIQVSRDVRGLEGYVELEVNGGVVTVDLSRVASAFRQPTGSTAELA
jgi:hypothetical protein